MSNIIINLPPPAISGAFKMHEIESKTLISSGISALDGLLQGGLAQGVIHEAYAAGERDAAAASGLALAFALLLGGSRALLWVRQDFLDVEAGEPYGPGLGEFGLDPTAITRVRARDTLGVLQAGLEAARCPSLGAVVIELWGEAKAFDLTASRRLALAAKASGVTVLIARIAAAPCPSAAETRWRVRAAPSRPLPANAPGNPAFSVTLLRHRSGASGQEWRLEWNRDRGCFEDGTARSFAADRASHAPPLSGNLVPVPFGRPGAMDGAQDTARRSLGKAG
jgi:protein ImuA